MCEIEDRVLEPDEIGRADEESKDQLVPIMDEELDDLPLPTARAIAVQAFVPAELLDPIRFGRPYYLQGDGAVAAKPYTPLREALQRSDKVAVAKFSWHRRRQCPPPHYAPSPQRQSMGPPRSPKPGQSRGVFVSFKIVGSAHADPIRWPTPGPDGPVVCRA
ncbi:Ku protein [Streptomyces sp. NPDC021212]|uniref:Ku protein n=1 Tax=Streptomyces sp. NPDC021212 TaxID=3365118 RepID=UPI0037AF4F1E